VKVEQNLDFIYECSVKNNIESRNLNPLFSDKRFDCVINILLVSN